MALCRAVGLSLPCGSKPLRGPGSVESADRRAVAAGQHPAPSAAELCDASRLRCTRDFCRGVRVRCRSGCGRTRAAPRIPHAPAAAPGPDSPSRAAASSGASRPRRRPAAPRCWCRSPPPPRTDRTRRVLHPVLIGHAASNPRCRSAWPTATTPCIRRPTRGRTTGSWPRTTRAPSAAATRLLPLPTPTST